MATSFPSWESPVAEPAYPARVIHLWLASLDIAEDQRRHLGKLLSADERRRADQFIFDQHRARFIAGRGILRILLGKYLQSDPAEILFSYNLHGKPSLDDRMKMQTVHFNLSHSCGLALFAFTGVGPIGVDIEHVRPESDIKHTGGFILSPNELLALQSVSPALRHTTFFQYWVRKEAFLKAIGEGFTGTVSAYDVCDIPEKPVMENSFAGTKARFTEWHVRDIPLEEGFAAALACKSNTWPLSFFRVPDTYFF